MLPRYKQLGLQALVFDFDGTLARQTIDFTVMRTRALEAARSFVVVPESAALLPTMEMLAMVGTETENARLACKAALEAVKQVEIQAAQTSSLFSFVRPMLEALPAAKLAMAIVTRNCTEAVKTVFPDVDCHALLLTRDDVSRVKPDAEHLVAALQYLSVAPENVLMVGDHPMDIDVGKRVGTLTAAVTSGEHDARSLASYDPDFLALDGGVLLRHMDIL